MHEVIKMNGRNWPVLEWKGRRVITTGILAEFYEASEQQIKQNFNNNTKNFKEGKHYFYLCGEELREFKRLIDDIDQALATALKFAPQLYLWTHQGASRHCKILGTTKAWEQFDVLEDNYYNFKPQIDVMDQILGDTDFGIRLLTAYKEEKEKNAGLQQEIQLKEEKISVMRPKEIFADSVSESESLILVRDLAKLLRQNGVDIGEKRLYAWMRENGYIIKSSNPPMPTQRAMDMGLFRVIERTINSDTGTTIVSSTTKVTGKGQQYFINKFIGDGADQIAMW